MGKAKRAVLTVLERRGYRLRRITNPELEFADRYTEIWDAHDEQTLEEALALQEKYREPVFGDVRVYELMEMLGQVIDPMDKGLGCVSQLVHSLQVAESLHDRGVTDPTLTLAALLHDVGKVLLLTGEDAVNVSSGNRALGPFEPGAGLDRCVFQWNHDEFGYSRFKDRVPDHVAWLIRYHSAQLEENEEQMDARDRDYYERYFSVFRPADLRSKSPYQLPTTTLADYRDLIEDTFPEPIPF